MKLQGRNLEPNHRGEDVKLLHSEFRQLGFSINDPDGFFGSSTFSAVQQFQKRQGIEPADGIVNERTAQRMAQLLAVLDGPRPHVVRGRVLHANGAGAPDRSVRVFAVGLETERLLGRGETDARGAYEIAYEPGESSVDLQVKVFISRQDRKPLVTSPLILNAEPEETINLALGDEPFRGEAEFERMKAAVATKTTPSSLARLPERAKILLARQAKLSEPRVSAFVDAHRLAERTGVDAAVLFALSQGDSTADLSTILAEGKTVHRLRLRQAIERNLIPASFADKLDAVVAQLQDLTVEEMLDGNGRAGEGDVAALLSTTRLSASQKRRFLRAHLDNEEPLPEFWNRMKEAEDFNDAIIDELQLTLQLGALTLNHAPLVQAVKERRGIADAQELAGLDEGDWLKLLETIEAPEEFRGESAKQTYAKTIMALVAKAYPTARLLSRWTRDHELGTESFRMFAEDNPDFEFRGTTVRRYVAEHPHALDGIADREAFLRELEGVHRLFSVVPDDEKFEPVRTLWQANLRSAQAVVGLGRGAFLRRFGKTMGEERTMQIFARARQKTALSLATLVKYAPVFNRLNPDMLGNFHIEEHPDEIAEWKTLFGSLDFCECRHCRSILSPAAYFVDLLQFLERADAGEHPALQALLGRRPDLAHILLDCANTNTAMPYIDLVNEVLENAVNNGLSNLSESPGLQTTATTEALRANPEHIDPGAYTKLANATFPWSLPFNLWHEERKVYLGRLGIKVWELMDVFHRAGDEPEPVDRAAAYFGMTRVEREIIVAENGGHGLGTTTAVLVLMRRTQTTFEELQEILTSRFINPSGKQIVFEDDSCALEHATLDPSAPERDRLHRFRRLQKISGFSVFELDLIFDALPFDDITNASLIQLSYLSRLKERFRLSVPELVSWWAPTVPTRPGPTGTALYTELFLNSAVNNPLNPVEKFFELRLSGPNNPEPELRTVRPFFADSEISSLIVGALNITEEELRLLIKETLPSREMNFRHLSHLHRVASVSRALGISVRDVLTLVRLTGQTGFTAFALPDDVLFSALPEDTWRWVETYDRLRGPGFRVDELNYLLLHRFEPSFALPLTDTDISLCLIDLQGELRKLRPMELELKGEEATPQELEAIATWLGEKLALVVGDAEEALRIVRGVSVLPEPEQTSFIEKHFASFLEPETLAASTEEGERLVYVYQQLVTFLSRSIAVQRLAAATGFDIATAQALLSDHLTAPSDPGRPAISVFLSGDFLFSSADLKNPTAVPEVYAIMRRLAKIRLVIGRLGIVAEDAAFLFSHGTGMGWYDLRSIPVEAVAEEAVDIEAWIRLLQAQVLNQRLFAPPFSLGKLLTTVADLTADRDAILAKLAEQAGWELESLDFLTGGGGYDFSFPEDFADERWVSRLSEAFALIRKAGISGAQIWSWNVPEASATLARSVKNAAKARYTNEQWLTIAPELSDQLRIRRRDALVDFLIAENVGAGINESDDLFARLLIDPAMQPCFLTSRIKQAISSVQLFVHRVFLGLESGVRFEVDDADEWLWRKNYRIWEAGRKVFLYPENFAEPELRSDKSPFFQELEDTLLQEEVTADAVERAYLRYLRSLDEVARLEIAGLYVEEQADVVHIFARTRGTPPVYFYRRYIANAYFTPWDKVEVNIEGGHVLPVIYNRRLWLLWLVFTDKASQPEDEDLKNPKGPRNHYRIKLSWSEYRDGKWSSPKTSRSWISTRVLLNDFEVPNQPDIPFIHGSKGRYYFWAEVDNGTLKVFPFYHHEDDPYDNCQPNRFFQFRGCNDDPVLVEVEDVLRHSKIRGAHTRKLIPYRVPDGSDSSYSSWMKFRQGNWLVVWSQLQVNSNGILSDCKKELVLAEAPSRFFITPPHQYTRFFSQAPFFYEDHSRTFLILPEDVIDSGSPGETVLLTKDYGSLGVIRAVRATFLPPRTELESRSRFSALPIQPLMEAMVFTPGAEDLVIDRSLNTNRSAARSEQEEEDDDIEEFLTETATPPSTPAGSGSTDILKDSFISSKKYRFLTFYHPYTCLFIEQLNRFGVDGLLRPGPKGSGKEIHRQLTPNSSFNFSTYGPQPGVVHFSHPTEEIDFAPGGAYSDYNWEVFFHIPLLIANRLSQNQRFEEAQQWYHYIFDPTETDDAGLKPEERVRRVWKMKHFFNFSKESSIQEMVKLINQGDADYENQVARWEADPFNPHLVASLRTVAYMKLVVMKYLDNLIAWADNLFRRDTIESINEATQLYVLAARILGRRPVEVPGKEAAPRTFAALRDKLDVLSNALAPFENQLASKASTPVLKTLTTTQHDHGASGKDVFLAKSKFALAPNSLRTAGASAAFGGALALVTSNGGSEPEHPPVLYFCVPNDQKLLEYFETLADRLFKIRNCMNIEGMTRTLDLFEPPIDPALLVKAAAAGIDLKSALDDLNAPLPHYRFTYLVQKAIELCNEVKGLGGALLSALEKKDAEALAVLRAGHQIDLLQFAKGLKELNIAETQESLEGLRKTKEVVQHRYDFYSSREFKNASEKEQESNLENANVFQLVGQGYDLAANIAHLIPDFKAGFQGVSSPEVTAAFGGQNIGQALQVFSKLYNLLAAISTHKATMAGIKAGHERRQEEWDLQAGLAQKELEQIDRQIAAAEIRVSLAEKDLDQQELQVARAQEEEAFLKEKFTNEQLYARMVSQVSSAYFQSYQMAYDLAKRAERSFRHELGVENTNFIAFGYWDNLIAGLHAAERLSKDLRRMEVSYMEQNRREYEITQHFSLALLNPRALLQLRETGRCQFNIPELAFDLSYPGHYMRRITSVSLTMPCVTGPYTNVSATLTLLKNRVRINGNSQGDYAYTGLEDQRFRHDLIGIQSIATSTAQNDRGLFEFNFRDERFLPFERAGAISTWQISLPDTFRGFDYNTITDVILHVSYTAREGGDALRGTVATHVGRELNRWLDEVAEEGQGLFRLISLKHEFSSELHHLFFPATGESQAATLPISRRHFPYFLRGRELTVTRAELFIKPKEGKTVVTDGLTVTLDGVQQEAPFGTIPDLDGLPATTFDLNRVIEPTDAPPWELVVTGGSLDPDTIDDLYLLLIYSVTPS